MALIYLDVDDEITSVANRIRRTTDAHIAIVVPPGSRLATSRINFRLLAREARERTRRLVVIAPDAAVRSVAAAAGLETHASVADYEAIGETRDARGAQGGAPLAARGSGEAMAAQDAGHRAATGMRPSHGDQLERGATNTAEPGGRPSGDAASGVAPTTGLPVVGGSRTRSGSSPRRRGRWIALSAAVLVLAIVAGTAAYLTLPTATVTIRPASEPLGPATVMVRADPAAAGADVATATVAATVVQVPVEVTDTFEATGKRVEETKASGSVTFVSKDPTSANTIPAGSVVRTEGGIGFATAETVTIPRARIVGLTILPGTAEVAVTAEKGGPEANVAANTVRIVPAGEDPILLEVSNKAPTAGGTRKTFLRVTQKDVDAATKTLRRRLDARFADAARDPTRAPEGTVIVTGTAAAGTATPDPDPSSLVGQEVDSFDLTLRATGTVTAYSPADVRALAAARLAANVPAGFELVSGSTKVELGAATADGAAIEIPATASGAVVRRIDPAAVRALVKGRSPADAVKALASYGDAVVDVWPGFVLTVTSTEARIEVRIEPAPTSSPPGDRGTPAPGRTPGPSDTGTPAGSPRPTESPSGAP